MMFFNSIWNKKKDSREDVSVEIRQMLNQTWDLSKKFETCDDSAGQGTAEIMNLYFSKLNTIVTAILKNVVRLSGLAPDLFRISRSFRTKSVEQARRIADISLSAKSMATRLEETAENSDAVSAEAQMMEKEVREAYELGRSSMAQFSDIQSHVRSLAETISILEENSASISSITGVIHDIADETNILSLNARIEAAKNSEANKGFKVIAEEISTLAKQSRVAAENIQTRLEVLSGKIDETVYAVRMVEQNIRSGEEKISRANRALSSVNSRITELTASMGTIKESIHLQSTDVKNVSTNLASIENTVQDQAAEVEKIFSIAGEVNGTCDEMIQKTGIFHLSAHQKVCHLAEAAAAGKEIAFFVPDRQEDHLRSLLKSHPFIELAYVTDGAGIQTTDNIFSPHCPPQVSAENMRGQDWSQKEWFRMPAKSMTPFISKVYRSSATQNFCFTIAVPVFAEDRFRGVLAFDINFRDLLEI